MYKYIALANVKVLQLSMQVISHKVRWFPIFLNIEAFWRSLHYSIAIFCVELKALNFYIIGDIVRSSLNPKTFQPVTVVGFFYLSNINTFLSTVNILRMGGARGFGWSLLRQKSEVEKEGVKGGHNFCLCIRRSVGSFWGGL